MYCCLKESKHFSNNILAKTFSFKGCSKLYTRHLHAHHTIIITDERPKSWKGKYPGHEGEVEPHWAHGGAPSNGASPQGQTPLHPPRLPIFL